MTITHLRLLLWLPYLCGLCRGWILPATTSTTVTQSGCRSTCRLFMAVTPVGPFCPYRSSSAMAIEPRMEAMSALAPEFSREMARLRLDMGLGQMPEPDRLLRLADGVDKALDQWESLLTRLRLSGDFQTREYAKLYQAHLDTYGLTVDSVASMMRWQAGCMRAMANNTPPPMPPANLDLEKMIMADTGGNQQKSGPPSVSAMTSAPAITAAPFARDCPALNEPVVLKEYEDLRRDHMALIEFGGKYQSFDPLGKIRFLDEVEKIQERWDIFFARFKLMGYLDKDYIAQCNQFLSSMGMNEDEYRKLLKKCHQIMREEAEQERNQPTYS